MLRVDIRDSANAVSLKLEGRFTGNDAENTRTLMTRCHDGMTLIVDLTEVTFIDSVGEEVLSFLAASGRSSLPRLPTHSICVNVSIFALLGIENWMPRSQTTARMSARRRKPR